MKITGILTSPRKNGNTKILLESVLKGAEQAGCETELISLNDYQINYCMGCLKCMKAGECIMNDDFDYIRTKIREADGIVYGTPTYMGDYNSKLRTLLERFGLYEHMTSRSFGGKYIAVVTTAGGNAGNTVKSLSNTAGIFGRGYFSGGISLLVKASKSSDYPEILAKCEKLGKKIAHDIKSGKKYAKQNLLFRIINSLFIRPQYKTVIKRHKDGAYKAVYDYLVNSGKI